MNPAKRALNPQGPLIKMETPNEVTIQKNYVLMNPNQMGQMPMNQMGGYLTENNKPMMLNQINPMNNKNFEVRNPSEFPENMPKKNMPMSKRSMFDPKQGLPNNSQISFEKQNYPQNYAMMPNYQMQSYGPNQEYKPMLYNPNMKQFYMGYPPKPNQNLPNNQSLSENDTNDDNSFAQRQKLMKMPPQPQIMSKPQPPAPQNLFHQMNMPNMNRQMGNANFPEILYKRMMMLNAKKDSKEDAMSTGSDLFGKGMMKSGDDNDSNKKPMFNFDNEHMMKLFRKNKSDLGQEKKMNALLMELANNKKHYKEKKQKASKVTKEKMGKHGHGSKVSKSSMNESRKQALNINNDSTINYPMNMNNFNNNPMNMNNFINNPMNINNSMNINNCCR